jgi:hypothetical protein
MTDLDHLESLARGADQQHIYTHPRDSNNWKANSAFVSACSPEVILRLCAIARAAERVVTVYSDEPPTDDPLPGALDAHAAECEQAWDALRAALGKER